MKVLLKKKRFKCLLCNWMFDEPVLAVDYDTKQAVINGKWGFHMYDTHGIAPEILPDYTRYIMTRLSDGGSMSIEDFYEFIKL